MTSSLAIIGNSDIMQILEMAKQLHKSGLLPKSIDTSEKAFAIITMGMELGIGAWQSLNGINVIAGKPTVSPQLMLALINQSGKLQDIKIDYNATSATCMMQRVGRSPHIETFTIDDAKRLQLTGKDNYTKQPHIMLKWRVVAQCARVVFPDVIMGLYTTEEIAPDSVTLDEHGEQTVIALPVSEPVKQAPMKWWDDTEVIKRMIPYLKENGVQAKTWNDLRAKHPVESFDTADAYADSVISALKASNSSVDSIPATDIAQPSTTAQKSRYGGV